VVRSADDRRNASSIISSSIRFASVGGQVDCTIKTSPPRTFSSIWKLNSPSEKRSVNARPMSQLSWRQISSANLGFAFPEKILMPPVVLIRSLPIADCQLPIAEAKRKGQSARSSRHFALCSQSAIGNRKSAIDWLGRVDSNQRMPVPKTGALPLGYAPVFDNFQNVFNRD
jgi:hypothetical protein